MSSAASAWFIRLCSTTTAASAFFCARVTMTELPPGTICQSFFGYSKPIRLFGPWNPRVSSLGARPYSVGAGAAGPPGAWANAIDAATAAPRRAAYDRFLNPRTCLCMLTSPHRRRNGIVGIGDRVLQHLRNRRFAERHLSKSRVAERAHPLRSRLRPDGRDARAPDDQILDRVRHA